MNVTSSSNITAKPSMCSPSPKRNPPLCHHVHDLMTGSAYWIWNEGVPADIPTFEGTRVVLLGPPPYERSWNSVRRFPDLAVDLHLPVVVAAK